MSASTSGRLHCEFVRLLFLQTHRETDRFFAGSGVQFAQSNKFHFRRAAFCSQFKSQVGHLLSKSVPLRINLNIDSSIECYRRKYLSLLFVRGLPTHEWQNSSGIFTTSGKKSIFTTLPGAVTLLFFAFTTKP